MAAGAEPAIDWGAAQPEGPPETAAPATGAQPNAPDWASAIPADEFGTAKLSHESLPMSTRIGLAAADSPEERQLFLTHAYGADNVRVVPKTTVTDYFGGGAKRTGPARKVATHSDTIAVRVGNQWIDSDSGSVLGGIEADAIAHAGELGGGAYGAMEGAAAGSVVPVIGTAVGAVAGGVIGALTGKAGEESVKGVMGNRAKTTSQAVEAYEDTALGQLGGDVLGAGANRVVGRLAKGRLPAKLTETTPERTAKFKELTAQGARPPLQSVAPGLKHGIRMEIMAQKLSGQAPRDAPNTAVISKAARRILKASGLNDADAGAALDDMRAGHAAATEDAGAGMQKAFQARTKMLTDAADKAMTQATAITDRAVTHLKRTIALFKPGANFGVDVGRGIEEARKSFGEAASGAYARVDKMIGGKPVVPIKPIAEQARRLLAVGKYYQASKAAGQIAGSLPKPEPVTDEEVKQLFHELGVELPASDSNPKITLAQAQRIRTKLSEQLRASQRLNSSTTDHEMGELTDSVDRAIQSAAIDPNNTDAIRLLNSADKFYAENVKKFNDVQVEELASRIRTTGIPANPREVANALVQSGETARALQFQKMLGPDLWRRVKAQDLENLVNDARIAGSYSDISDPLSGQIDGMSLLGAVEQRANVMEAIHGKAATQQLYELAQSLAATDGKLDVKLVSNGQMQAFLEQWHTAQAELEQYVKHDPLGALASMKKSPEQVYSILTKPGNGSRLRLAVKALGAGSPEVKQVQQVALQRALYGAMQEMSRIGPGQSSVSGSLGRYLNKWSKGEQDLLFPHGTADALTKLNEDMQFLFPRPMDGAAASITAGAIQQKFFVKRWWIQANLAAARFFLDHPGVQRYFVVGRERGAYEPQMDWARLQFARQIGQSVMGGVDDNPDANADDESDGETLMAAQ